MVISTSITAADIEQLRLRLAAYNAQAVPYQGPHYQELHLTLRDEQGTLKGGVIAYLHNLHLFYIDTLWVDADIRKQGYGSRLLNKVEQLALEQGARMILLDTYEFQAPDFYTRFKYECFAVVEDCPLGYKRYYFRKQLK